VLDRKKIKILALGLVQVPLCVHGCQGRFAFPWRMSKRDFINHVPPADELYAKQKRHRQRFWELLTAIDIPVRVAETYEIQPNVDANFRSKIWRGQKHVGMKWKHHFWAPFCLPGFRSVIFTKNSGSWDTQFVDCEGEPNKVNGDSFRYSIDDLPDSVRFLLSFFHDLLAYLPFDMNKAIDLRSKCGHFRILIIGRANAGKTTILKKVCNSIDDPETFSPSGKKVSRSAFER